MDAEDRIATLEAAISAENEEKIGAAILSALSEKKCVDCGSYTLIIATESLPQDSGGGTVLSYDEFCKCDLE